MHYPFAARLTCNKFNILLHRIHQTNSKPKKLLIKLDNNPTTTQTCPTPTAMSMTSSSVLPAVVATLPTMAALDHHPVNARVPSLDPDPSPGPDPVLALRAPAPWTTPLPRMLPQRRHQSRSAGAAHTLRMKAKRQFPCPPGYLQSSALQHKLSHKAIRAPSQNRSFDHLDRMLTCSFLDLTPAPRAHRALPPWMNPIPTMAPMPPPARLQATKRISILSRACSPATPRKGKS